MDDIWGAAEAGDLGEVERQLGHDPGLLNAKDDEGFTPLMIASYGGHVGVVRLLLDKGAALDEQDREGRTPKAVWPSSSQRLMLALALGSPSSTRTTSRWPLVDAAIKGVQSPCLEMAGSAPLSSSNRTTGVGPKQHARYSGGLLQGPRGGREGAARERGRPHDRQPRRHHPHGHRQGGSSGS
jgi:hypothetical protein